MIALVRYIRALLSQLTRRGQVVLVLLVLLALVKLMEYFTMTHVTLRFIGTPPPDLSTQAVVEQDLKPARNIPFWSAMPHVFAEPDPIYDSEWQPVLIGRRGGDLRLPRWRRISPGGYYTIGNKLYVGVPGISEFTQRTPPEPAPGFESSKEDGTTYISYHILATRRGANGYAIDLPGDLGGGSPWISLRSWKPS